MLRSTWTGPPPHLCEKTLWVSYCVQISFGFQIIFPTLTVASFIIVSIGDKIATSNPASDTSPNGSSTWYVDKVTLFATTVRYATTNEVATYSNGSLAVLRIINANRSPKAIISVMIKFGLETPFNKITVFRSAVENFIKARPRWACLSFPIFLPWKVGTKLVMFVLSENGLHWLVLEPLVSRLTSVTSNTRL